MTPAHILSAVRLGKSILAHKHASLRDLWKKFGQSVRCERHRKKITQKDFAKRIGCTAAMLYMMEKGVRPWPMKRAEKAVKLLTRPVQWPDGGKQ